MASGDQVDVWGAQLEAGSKMTSYYPTAVCAATRPAGYIDSWQSYDYDSGWVPACPWPAVKLRGPLFEFFRADGSGERVKYFEMVLENVLIGSVKPGLQPGVGMQEYICLKFVKVTWKYTRQKITGGAGGSTAGGWDLSANKIIA